MRTHACTFVCVHLLEQYIKDRKGQHVNASTLKGRPGQANARDSQCRTP